jgi:hypothetical protein
MVMPNTSKEKGSESLFLLAIACWDAACLLTFLPKQTATGSK